jgi:perosamine synthetase
MYPLINTMLIKENDTLRDAMKNIDQNCQGACFIINNDRQIIGILTDGDIRRALLGNMNLATHVTHVMNREFIRLPVDTPGHDILEKLSDRVKIIPLIDERGIPVDYAGVHKLHHIPIASPLLMGNELAYVTDCIKTGWVSSQGTFVGKFETMFRDYCEMPYALAVSNGTVALHLALVALDIGEGDEVIVPDLTFAASINAIIYTGATPVIADIDPVTWTLDPASVERMISPQTKAIMPVHLYGHPCHMDELLALATKHNLYVVEDCAEALGSKYNGQPVGTFSDAATFSFFGNKTITTGEGGMIIFKDEKIYKRAQMLRDHGMSKEKRYWHLEVGFNYRLTNLQAALGVAQMERVTEFVEAKRKIADTYNSVVNLQPEFTAPPSEKWAYSSYWLYTFIVKPDSGLMRDRLIDKLLKKGIETRPIFYPLHVMPPYIGYRKDGDMLVSTYVSRNGISLPSSVSISEEELFQVVRALHEILDTHKILISEGI